MDDGPDAPVRAGERGRIAVVWSPQGSTGRSTVAASLATALAASGSAVLVDADLEAPSLAQMLALPEDVSGLATAARLAGRGRLDPEVLEGLLLPTPHRMSFLPGLGRPGRWRELPPAAADEVWGLARELAEWTVIDIAGGLPDDETDEYTLEPGRGAVAAGLIRQADVLVVVGTGDPIGIRRLVQLLGELGDGLAPAGETIVVANRVRASTAGPAPERAIAEALGRFGGVGDPVFLPEDPASADRSLMEGVPVIALAPDKPLGRTLAVLADRVDPRAGAVAASRRSRRGLRRLVPRAGEEAAEASGTVPGRRRPGDASADPAPDRGRDATASGSRLGPARRRRGGGKHRG